MTKTHADYYDALHSEEAVRISNAIYSLLEDYVRYFNSQGFQIRRDWIDEAFSAATSSNGFGEADQKKTTPIRRVRAQPLAL